MKDFEKFKEIVESDYRLNRRNSNCFFSVLHSNPVTLRFSNTMTPDVGSSAIAAYLKQYLPHLVFKTTKTEAGTYTINLNEDEAATLLEKLKAGAPDLAIKSSITPLLATSTEPSTGNTTATTSVSSTSTPSSVADVGKIVVVSLDLASYLRIRSNFNELTAREKIQLISEHIESVCQELKRQSPDAMWIIGWREYGITEKASRFISHETLSYFQENMLRLTKEHPNLAILSGTVAVKRHFDHLKYQARLPKMLEEYNRLDGLRDSEGREGSSIRRHKDNILKLEAIKTARQETDGVDVVSNTAYLFQGDTIQKHRKIAPWEETQDKIAFTTKYGTKFSFALLSELESGLPNTIYRTASAKTGSPNWTLIHPHTKYKVPIGIEICYEHQLGVLQKAGLPKPLLHFIVSDSIVVQPRRMHGQLVIQFDSKDQPNPVLAGDQTAVDIKFFRHNLQTDRNLPLIPVLIPGLVERKSALAGGSPLTGKSASSLYAKSSISSSSRQPAVSYWTTLLAKWIDEPANKANNKEAITRFSAAYPGKLPMNYMKSNGKKISILDFATEDRNLFNELKRRSEMHTVPVIAEKNVEERVLLTPSY